MKKLLFVCLGNICRSPMAEFVMKDLVKKQGLAGYEIASAATSPEDLGDPPYRLTRDKLAEHGISCAGKTAWTLEKKHYDQYDLFLGMEQKNVQAMERIFGGDPKGKVKRLLDFADRPPERRDIADPWHTRDFEQTWQDVSEGCLALLRHLEGEGAPS